MPKSVLISIHLLNTSELQTRPARICARTVICDTYNSARAVDIRQRPKSPQTAQNRRIWPRNVRFTLTKMTIVNQTQLTPSCFGYDKAALSAPSLVGELSVTLRDLPHTLLKIECYSTQYECYSTQCMVEALARSS